MEVTKDNSFDSATEIDKINHKIKSTTDTNYVITTEKNNLEYSEISEATEKCFKTEQNDIMNTLLLENHELSDSENDNNDDNDNTVGDSIPSTSNSIIQKSKCSRAQKKLRKIFVKLGLKQIPDIRIIVMKKVGNISFTINEPEVYNNPNNDTYIIFGDIHVSNLDKSQQDQSQLQNLIGKYNTDSNNFKSAKISEKYENDDTDDDDNDQEFDETKIDEKDIELVMSQAGVNRRKAIKSLRNNDNDIVNAIMDLTML